MTDTPPTRRRHDGDTTTDRDIVSPTEAAARLGITPDAVRARLRRGTLAGERVGGDWHVFVPRDTTPTEPQHDDRYDGDATPPPERHDADTTLVASLIAAKDETIARLDAEIAFLRSELETRTDGLQRRDVLLREALGRIPQLAAGEDARSSPTGGEANARPEPVREATQAPEPHRPSVVGSVWRRLFGGG